MLAEQAAARRARGGGRPVELAHARDGPAGQRAAGRGRRADRRRDAATSSTRARSGSPRRSSGSPAGARRSRPTSTPAGCARVTAPRRPASVLSGLLGPGLLGQAFDGLLRPLSGAPVWLTPERETSARGTRTWAFESRGRGGRRGGARRRCSPSCRRPGRSSTGWSPRRASRAGDLGRRTEPVAVTELALRVDDRDVAARRALAGAGAAPVPRAALAGGAAAHRAAGARPALPASPAAPRPRCPAGSAPARRCCSSRSPSGSEADVDRLRRLRRARQRDGRRARRARDWSPTSGPAAGWWTAR